MGVQPFSLSSTPPKWLAELEKDDMDMLQGKVISDSQFKDLIHTLPPSTIHFQTYRFKVVSKRQYSARATSQSAIFNWQLSLYFTLTGDEKLIYINYGNKFVQQPFPVLSEIKCLIYLQQVYIYELISCSDLFVLYHRIWKSHYLSTDGESAGTPKPRFSAWSG